MVVDLALQIQDGSCQFMFQQEGIGRQAKRTELRGSSILALNSPASQMYFTPFSYHDYACHTAEEQSQARAIVL
jgi:hypothetical protein